MINEENRGHEALRKAARAVVLDWGQHAMRHEHYRAAFQYLIDALKAALTPAAPETPTEDEVSKAKEDMRQRLVVCDMSDNPHSYAICSCTEGHTNSRLASAPLTPTEPVSMPFYGNSLCAKCGGSLAKGCHWIPGEGETPSKMAVCEKCFQISTPQSRVRTSFIHPPIPVRAFDWVAWIDGEEESMRYGYGRTEQEAKDELSNVLGELNEAAQPPAAFQLVDVHAISKLIRAYAVEGGEPDRKEYPADTCEELLARIGQIPLLSSCNLVALPDVEKAILEEFRARFNFSVATLQRFFEGARARLKPEPAKQERVTVHYSAKLIGWVVYDGEVSVGPLFLEKLNAERYATGLRAEIAEKATAK